MKRYMKTMPIVGIVISTLGLIGSLLLIGDDFLDGFVAIVIYGYFLAFSVSVLKADNKRSKR